MNSETILDGHFSKTDNFVHASFARRFLAQVVDRAVIFLFLVLFPNLVMPLASWVMKITSENPSLGYLITYMLILPLILIIYNTLFESSKMQGSPGKYLLKLKVTDSKYKRLSFVKALVRNLGKILSSMIIYLGYLMVLTTKKKQALHDILAKTYVVRTK